MKLFLAVVLIVGSIFGISYLLHQRSWSESNTSAPVLSQSRVLHQRVKAIMDKMTLEEKIDYVSGVDAFYTKPIPRLGVPSFKMADGPIGVRNCGPTVSYPASICTASTIP